MATQRKNWIERDALGSAVNFTLPKIRIMLLSVDTLYYQVSSKERRSKLEIYFTILIAIKEEAENGEVKPTRIQFKSNTSYDKLSKYLDELTNKDLISRKPLSVTDKGREFLTDYNKVDEVVRKIGLKYIYSSDDYSFN